MGLEIEEQKPLIATPSQNLDGNSSSSSDEQHNRQLTGTLIVCALTLLSVVPQTVVALEISSMALLADSLCMWSDIFSYCASIAVFWFLSNPKERSAHGPVFDFLGAFIGWCLLIASATYVTVHSVDIYREYEEKQAVNGDGIKWSVMDTVDGKWGIIFSVLGAVVDLLCVWALLKYSDPMSSISVKKVNEHDNNSMVGTASMLSVVLHLGADIARLFGLLISGIVSQVNPKTSALTDATASLIICGVMYVGSCFLLYHITVLLKVICCTTKDDEEYVIDSSSKGDTI
jgi:Co/Zn/Cd efflux system component